MLDTQQFARVAAVLPVGGVILGLCVLILVACLSVGDPGVASCVALGWKDWVCRLKPARAARMTRSCVVGGQGLVLRVVLVLRTVQVCTVQHFWV
jgi:hypothetical protein